MAVTFAEGFEIGAVADTGLVLNTTGGTISVSSAEAHTGTYSLDMNKTGSGALNATAASWANSSPWPVGSGSGTGAGYVHWFKIATMPSAAVDIRIYKLTTGSTLAAVSLDNSGVMRLGTAGSPTGGNTIATGLTTGVWHRLEVTQDVSANPHSYTARLDGGPAATWTIAQAADQVGGPVWGTYASGSGTYRIYVEGIRDVGPRLASVPADVNGEGMDFDVAVEAGSASPLSQREQAQNAMAWVGAISGVPQMAALVNWPAVARMVTEAFGFTPEKVLLDPALVGQAPPQEGEVPVGPPIPLEGDAGAPPAAAGAGAPPPGAAPPGAMPAGPGGGLVPVGPALNGEVVDPMADPTGGMGAGGAPAVFVAPGAFTLNITPPPDQGPPVVNVPAPQVFVAPAQVHVAPQVNVAPAPAAPPATVFVALGRGRREVVRDQDGRITAIEEAPPTADSWEEPE